MYAQSLSAFAFATDKIISQKQVQKKLESTVVCMGRKDDIGNDRFFLPYNTSLLQTFRKKKYKSEINLHGDAFSLLLTQQ